MAASFLRERSNHTNYVNRAARNASANAVMAALAFSTGHQCFLLLGIEAQSMPISDSP